MTSANTVVSQMQLWQDCNDTSTQLVDKTVGEICGKNIVKTLFWRVEMSVVELWFYEAILNIFIYYLVLLNLVFLLTFTDLLLLVSFIPLVQH